jgi:hypothetical protein
MVLVILLLTAAATVIAGLWRRSLRSALLALGGGLAFLLVWALTETANVRAKALAEAGDAPACIQVAAPRGRYRPAESLADLSPLTMAADRNLGFHALLVVRHADGVRAANWSYRQRRFEPGPVRGPFVCEPDREAIRRLSFWRSAPPAQSRFVLLQRHAYRFGPGERIRISESSANLEVETPRGRPEWLRRGLEVRLPRPGEMQQALRERPAPGSRIQPLRAPDGAIVGMAGCGPDLRACRFRFFEGDIEMLLEADPDMLPRWREVQAWARGYLAARRT